MVLYGILLPQTTDCQVRIMTNTFSETLTRLLAEHGMTPEGLSANLGIPLDRFRAWENGSVQPTLEEARLLADAMGVSLDELSPRRLPRLNSRAFGDSESEEEKRRMIAEYEAADEARTEKGRRLVRIILIVEAILSLISLILTLDLLSAALSVVLIVFLWRGKPAARWAFVICSVLSAAVTSTFIGPALQSAPPLALWVLAIVAYRVAACALILFNRSIRDFLYDQDTK